MTITPKIMTEAHVADWIDANAVTRGIQHVRRLARFWAEAEQGTRLIWAVRMDEAFVGHITLQPRSEYPGFKKAGIPEIVDLWVDPEHRGRGIGERLLLRAVEEARVLQAPAIGLGVGVTHDFGAAHRVYVKHGFIPDGKGLWVQGRQAQSGDTIALCDQALLMLVKTL